MASRLENLLLIREGESRDVAYFLVFFMLVSGGMAVGRGSADALFMKRLGIEYLPLMYMVQSILLAACSLVYAAFADRIAAERLFRQIFLVIGVLVCASWALMSAADNALAYPFYYLLYEVTSEVLLVHATLYMYQNFHTLQAKRLTPLFFAGAQAGTICGGLLLVFGAPRLGTQNLLLAWCGLLLAGIIVITIRHRRHGPSRYFQAQGRRRATLHDSIEQVRQGVHFTCRSSLLRAASFSLFFMVIAFYVLCYSVHRVYNQTFPTEDQLAGFYGMLTAGTSGFALVAQLFITNRVIKRFGIRRINLLFPVTTVASLGVLAFSFTLPAALIGSINKDAIMQAFRNPVRNMFFNVLPDYMQGRARALSVALVLPLALMVCGGMLAVMQRMDNTDWFLIPGIFAALCYLYSCRQMNRAYVDTLLTTLKERLFLPDERMYRELGGCSEDGYEEIMRGVNHPDPDVALAFSRVLAGSFPDRAAGIILERAAHSDNRTADRLLSLLQTLDIRPYSAELRELARRGDDHLRSSLLRLQIDTGTAAGFEPQWLDHPNPRLRAAAIHAALLLPVDTSLRNTALAAWDDLFTQDSGAQLAALDLVPDLRHLEGTEKQRLNSACAGLFSRLVQHDSPPVRLRALRGLRTWRDRLPDEVARYLLEALGSDNAELRSAGAACLHLVDTEQRDALVLHALGDANRRIREAALDALRVTRQDYQEQALAWIEAGSGGLRAQHELLQSLAGGSLPRPVFESIARNKLQEARRLQAALQVLEQHGAPHGGAAFSILRYNLREQLEQTIEMALLAMEPLYEPGLIRIIRAGFTSRDTRHIANAIEALENLPGQETVAGLAEILQQATGNANTGGTVIFSHLDEVLVWCSGHANDWLRECATIAMQGVRADSLHA